MEDEDQDVKVSVLVSTTQPRDDSSEEEDVLAQYPGLARSYVSTEDVRNYAKTNTSWWKRTTGSLAKRPTSKDRCGTCGPCITKNTKKNTCKSKGEDLCHGCDANHTCWRQPPCVKWTDHQKASFWANKALQAYNHPSPSSRVELLQAARRSYFPTLIKDQK